MTQPVLRCKFIPTYGKQGASVCMLQSPSAVINPGKILFSAWRTSIGYKCLSYPHLLFIVVYDQSWSGNRLGQEESLVQLVSPLTNNVGIMPKSHDYMVDPAKMG